MMNPLVLAIKAVFCNLFLLEASKQDLKTTWIEDWTWKFALLVGVSFFIAEFLKGILEVDSTIFIGVNNWLSILAFALLISVIKFVSKIGEGDVLLLVGLQLAFPYWVLKAPFAIMVFMLGAGLSVVHRTYLGQELKTEYAFVPYLYAGFLITLLLLFTGV